MSFNSKHRLTGVKIAVFGDRQVGKTAFAVRYLTKRFIGEYDSNKEIVYTHRTMIDRDDVTIEILDCSSQNEDSLRQHISWADGYILMFSVVDKKSLHRVDKIYSLILELSGNQGNVEMNQGGSPGTLQVRPSHLQNTTRPTFAFPLVLVCNKIDLQFSRMVSETDCCKLADKLDCPWFELSVSENGDVVNEVVEEVIRQVKREAVRAREGAPGSADKSMLDTVKRVLKKKIYRSKSDTV